MTEFAPLLGVTVYVPFLGMRRDTVSCLAMTEFISLLRDNFLTWERYLLRPPPLNVVKQSLARIKIAVFFAESLVPRKPSKSAMAL